MKNFDPNILKRRSIRLKGYDYRLAGAYFITLVSWQRENIFGCNIDGKIQLSSVGRVIESEWRKFPNHFPYTQSDVFVIMPNHLHAIIVIKDSNIPPMNDSNSILPVHTSEPSDWSQRRFKRPSGPPANSLGAIIGQFKSRVTKRVWSLSKTDQRPIWLRNYYDHIIRDDQEFLRIVQYIEVNPQQCQDDPMHHPDNF